MFETTAARPREGLSFVLRKLRLLVVEPPEHPRGFHDGYRGIRGLVIGTAVTLVLLRELPINEATSIGFLAALAIDLQAITRKSQKPSALETSWIFGVRLS